MKQITPLSDDPIQSMSATLPDGSKVSITLQYIQANKGWYISIGYGAAVQINMRRIVTSPNMLVAFKNVLPFGISCVTPDGYEPIYKTDFLSGRASLYLLSASDVAYVNNTIIPRYA